MEKELVPIFAIGASQNLEFFIGEDLYVR